MRLIYRLMLKFNLHSEYDIPLQHYIIVSKQIQIFLPCTEVMLRLDDMDKEGGKANEIAVSHPLIERFVTLVG